MPVRKKAAVIGRRYIAVLRKTYGWFDGAAPPPGVMF